MDHERIKEIMADEEFVNQLAQMESAEEVQAAFKEKGIEFGIEELEKIKEFASGDLTLDQLDDVAGGSAIAVSLIITGGGIIVAIINKMD